MAVDENDSFIREVNEDIRQERIWQLWKLLKPYILGGALAIIVFTILVELYSAYKIKQAQALSDSYNAALQLADDGSNAEALTKLAAVEKSGFGGYPMLAAFRKASLLQQKGDKAEALKAFDALAANGSLPKAWRDLATVRAAYILVDKGSFADIEERVKLLDNDAGPIHLAAREALGLAAWKAGQLQKAAAYFNRNYSDNDSVNTGFGERAGLMLSLIGSESENKAQTAIKAAGPRANSIKPLPASPLFKQGQ